MACCGRSDSVSAAATTYPYEATMPDGSKVTVTSAADERTQREKFRQAERERARTAGYTVRR